MSPGVRWAGAALAAVLTAAAHPPLAAWPLVFLAPAVLAAVLEGVAPGRAFALGWVASAGAGLALAHWLVRALVVEYGVAVPAALAVWLCVVGLAATLPAAGIAVYARLRPRATLLAAPLLLAACWSLADWLRAAPLGLPWMLPAHALARVPVWLQGAAAGGALLVGAVPLLAGAGLGIAARRRSARPLAATLAPVAALGLGALRLAGPPPADGASVEVAVVQAAVPPDERFEPGSAWRNTARHAARTRALAADGTPDLVVWSETAVDDDLDATPGLARALAALASEIGAPLVTGAPRSAGGRRTNSVVLVAPGRGIAESYAKQRLVPFSESDPAWGAPLAPLLGPVTAGPGYAAGREATVFRQGPLPFAAPVCFEITDPGLVRGFRHAGALLLLNLSNDAWFGRTGYAETHLRHAILRAVELRTWIVRAANTGISAVIDPEGRVVAELGSFEEGVVRARVGAAGPPTAYARFGDGPVLAALVAVVLVAVRPRRGGERGA